MQRTGGANATTPGEAGLPRWFQVPVAAFRLEDVLLLAKAFALTEVLPLPCSTGVVARASRRCRMMN